MKKSVVLILSLLLGLGLSVLIAKPREARAVDFLAPACYCQASSNIKIEDSRDSGLPIILLAKDNGKSNGGKAKVSNGQEDEEDEGDKEDDKEFDRLWDVILYG
ncbi:MAG: hypothetical protein QG577_2672 [Thermodesulfobacteriota bacterium]|nr:hypothetical protein [Thermodesulfobacteriota bacterium]